MAPVVRVLQLFVFAVAICFFSGCGQQSTTRSADVDHSPVLGAVELEIEFNSDRRNIKTEVPCSADSTVFTILERAQNLSDLKFKAINDGNPAKTFVNSIGGVDNMAGAGDNWIYLVNEKLGDKSSALFAVKPGDHVKWVFGKYEPE